jgi:hypothetical protein
MKLFRAVFVAVVMLAAALPVQAGKMAKSKDPLVADPAKATIVFMRPGKFVGAAVAVPVYHATTEQPEFIGLIDAGSKFAYAVEPGEHVFMTTIFGGSSGVRFYKAQVEAGKTYYFRAHIIEGIWGLEPVRGTALAGEEFAKWDKGTKLTVNTPKTLAWGEENKAKAAERRAALLPANISEENTLHADDGR